MEVKVKRSDNQLVHSDTFLGDEFSDELYHWKYISKKKVDGKWRYYYDTSELDKYLKNQTTTWSGGRGMINVKTTHGLGDSLRDTHRTLAVVKTGTNDNIKNNEKVTTYNEKKLGKLSQAIAKGERWLFDNLFPERLK